jgi:hypothetical protein
MQGIVTISIVIAASFLLAAFLLVRKLVSGGSRLPITSEWIGELSIERYRPMMRLLDGTDLAFLRSQPGFTARMATELRVQRCQIFRGYLRCLDSDFGRVYAAIKVMMLQSRRDRPDLAAVLLQQRAQFACAMLEVRLSLFLYRWGLCGRVDAGGLVRTFDVMRRELRTLVPSSEASLA